MSTNVGNVAGGHRANLKNPNTSEEAKKHSRQVLSELGTSGELQETDSTAGKNTVNVIRGHKAALKNPNVSKEAKEHSRAVLEDTEAI